MTSRVVRAKSLFQIAAIPALLLSVFGDFFTPVGGAAVVGVTGVISILLGFQMLIASRSGSTSMLERIVGREEKNAWWWEGAPPIRRHAFGVAFLFGVICLVSASQSIAERDSGGFIAQNVPAIGAAQTSFLGEISKNTRETADNTRETADNTREIAENTEGGKRETSQNPRKELQNQGLAWEEAGLYRAIERGDVKSVELYVRGGMPINVLHLFDEWNVDVARVVRAERVVGDEEQCNFGAEPVWQPQYFAEESFLTKRGYLRDDTSPDEVQVDSDKVATFKSLCGSHLHLFDQVRGSCDAMRAKLGGYEPGTGGAETLRRQLPFCRKLAEQF